MLVAVSCSGDANKVPTFDARVAFDAPMTAADAPAGGADAPVFDARPVPDARPEPLRPYSGPTAKLRLIDGRIGSAWPGVAVKICLFGDNSDPRPYAVLSESGSYTVMAEYRDVPALDLRVSVHQLYYPDSSTFECDPGSAGPLRAGGLFANAHYTAFYHQTHPFAECGTGVVDGCQFYPITGANAEHCAATGLAVLRDGGSGSGGFRVINATYDAALLSHGTTAENKVITRHVDIGFSEAYAPARADAKTNVCPEFVGCLGASAADAYTACAGGDLSWIEALISNPRIANATAFTTFYVVNGARALKEDKSGLENSQVLGVVTAYDVTN